MAQTEKRLVGEDATIMLDGTLTAKTAGNTTTAGNFYRVTAKGGSSVFPAGVQVGSWFISETVLTLATGDTADEAAPTTFIDVTEFSVSMSKAEIDVTTLSDVVKAYRSGKTDMTGTFSGIRTVDALAAAGQVARNAVYARFLNTSTQDGTTIVESGDPTDTLAWFFAYTNDATATGDVEEILILPVRFTGMDLVSISVDGAQTWSGSFRIDGSYKPQILLHEIQ